MPGGSQNAAAQNDGREAEVTAGKPHHLSDSLAGACGDSFFASSKCLRASATAPACFSACASA